MNNEYIAKYYYVTYNSYELQIIEKFNILLSENIKISRSVKYYAELLAVSAKKLNSITKTCIGKTAKEYIEERVIIDSKTLLLDTHNTVKEISYSMGFTEPTNFNKFFKKHTATTPQQFRRQFETHHINKNYCSI
jgi:AraC-like DNA-binding protein